MPSQEVNLFKRIRTASPRGERTKSPETILSTRRATRRILSTTSITWASSTWSWRNITWPSITFQKPSSSLTSPMTSILTIPIYRRMQKSTQMRTWGQPLRKRATRSYSTMDWRCSRAISIMKRSNVLRRSPWASWGRIQSSGTTWVSVRCSWTKTSTGSHKRLKAKYIMKCSATLFQLTSSLPKRRKKGASFWHPAVIQSLKWSKKWKTLSKTRSKTKRNSSWRFRSRSTMIRFRACPKRSRRSSRRQLCRTTRRPTPP